MTDNQTREIVAKVVALIRDMDMAKRELQVLLAAFEPKPCVYQARPYPQVSYGSVPVGAWCKTHGWDCPNNRTE